MSAKASPTVVGAFALGGIVLLTLALMIFGGGRFLEERRSFVTYFEGSLQGLRVGSDVLFRGVRVGFVSDIQVQVDEARSEFLVPVIFQILPEAIALVGPDEGLLLRDDDSPSLDELIQRGLRTRLETESFVTGQLVLELDFYPDTPIKLYGSPYDFPEIPSVPSNIQRVLRAIQNFIGDLQETVDVGELVTRIDSVLEGIDVLVRSDALHGTLDGLDRLSNSKELQALPATLTETLALVEYTLGEIRVLVAATDENLQPLLQGTEESLETLGATLRDASTLLDTLSTELGGDSELNYQLRETLAETRAAARSLRHLVEFLERNPEALLRGRPPPREP